VPYVCEHIEDLLENKDKLVCFVHHNDVARLIHEKFADRSVLVMGPTPMDDRAEAIKRFWNDDKVELFIGSLKTSGIGINLQCAANIVFAELDWVPGVITQAEDRCHRIGQEKSLLVQHLVAQNSMDSNMAKKIVAKQKSIQKALNKGAGE
jgi:SNF2 family DNA or RNA helicase